MINNEIFEKEELEKDEIQLMKAEMKVEDSKALITHLIDMNDQIYIDDQKKYTIILDYVKHDDYVKFNINIIRGNNVFTNTSLFCVNFSLRDLETGLSLFDDIRDCYIAKNRLLYTGFSTLSSLRNNLYSSFEATGENHIDLKYMIHTPEEQERLMKFNDSLYQKDNSKIKLKKVNCRQQ